jgi:hypothetical protein
MMTNKRVIDSITRDHAKGSGARYVFVRKASGGGYWKRVA